MRPCTKCGQPITGYKFCHAHALQARRDRDRERKAFDAAHGRLTRPQRSDWVQLAEALAAPLRGP